MKADMDMDSVRADVLGRGPREGGYGDVDIMKADVQDMDFEKADTDMDFVKADKDEDFMRADVCADE